MYKLLNVLYIYIYIYIYILNRFEFRFFLLLDRWPHQG